MYSEKYKKLFSKHKIGNVELRNRIVMSPMGTGHVGPDSRITQELTVRLPQQIAKTKLLNLSSTE